MITTRHETHHYNGQAGHRYPVKPGTPGAIVEQWTAITVDGRAAGRVRGHLAHTHPRVQEAAYRFACDVAAFAVLEADSPDTSPADRLSLLLNGHRSQRRV